MIFDWLMAGIAFATFTTQRTNFQTKKVFTRFTFPFVSFGCGICIGLGHIHRPTFYNDIIMILNKNKYNLTKSKSIVGKSVE